MTEPTKGRRGPPAHDPLCYQTLQDIVIPAGTLFRSAAKERGGRDNVETAVGFGKDVTGFLNIEKSPAALASGHFKAVVA